MSVLARLSELKINIPLASKPVGSYVPATLVGNLIYISGQLPFKEGQLIHQGRVGDSISSAQATECARLCLINGLAALGTLDIALEQIKKVVKITGYVNATPEFANHAQVLNGASDLLVAIFGERGKHARAAVGVASLPLGSCIELELILQI